MSGEVSEWLMVPLSKSGRLKGLAGSNPALSALGIDEVGSMIDEAGEYPPFIDHRSYFIDPVWRGRLVA
jgi:hypothetical protein